MTIDDALTILRKTYGYSHFRGQQAEIVDHVVNGGSAFVLMPTGSGKSLCYQIPSLCRDGVGVIVSPLIALMQDQVNALNQLGIRAAAINSSMTDEQITNAKRSIRNGDVDLIYVAPERLLMDDFLDLLDHSTIALFAIDEAHCVSQWGHDFRPHYQQLNLLATRYPHIPRIALTATADGPTRKDIIERLALTDGRSFLAGFDRPNIHYTITLKDQPKQQLLDYIKQGHAGESGIVYCLSRKVVEETAAWLVREGLNALPYHAGLDATTRAQNQERFLQGDAIIMVATIAFGMGIDKPDVRFVAHMSIPKNIEAFYQETGRAGRDGLPADTMMLYSIGDAAQLRSFIDGSNAPEQQKRIEHHKLNALLGLCEAVNCRRQVMLEYFGDSCAPCNHCDTCLNPPESFDGTIAALKALSSVYRTGQRFGVAYLIDILLGKPTERNQGFGHHQLKTFGVGVEYGKQEWQSIFRQLVAHNLLCVDVVEHGGIKITSQGEVFLKNRTAIRLSKYKSVPAHIRKERQKNTGIGFSSNAEESLFLALKSCRRELAVTQNVPPYVIFHDKTLREMASIQPDSSSALLQISGIGERKMERYGQSFLEVIVTHVQKQAHG